jgi:uncharacterized protein
MVVLHMSIWSIGDLHLSGTQPKPMDVFGAHWTNHWEKIQTFWRQHVTANDTILLAGDHSWAMRLTEALLDLEQIGQLPGKKVLIRGNHDYWWDTVAKVNKAIPAGMVAIQADFTLVEDYAICGTRGWVCPDSQVLPPDDLKIYQRELGRLEIALSKAQQQGHAKRIALLHYPPVSESREPSGFTTLLKKYRVEHCIYGHLHSAAAKTALEGCHNGVQYHLVACDYLNFQLKKIV